MASWLFWLLAEELGQMQAYAALDVERREAEQMLENIDRLRDEYGDASEMIETNIRDRLFLLDEIARDIAVAGMAEIDEDPGPRLVWVNPAIGNREKANATPRANAV